MSTTVRLKDATEERLVVLANRLTCGNCCAERDLDTSDVEEFTSFEDLWDLDTYCGCDDPVPNASIVQDQPLFGVPEVDDDYHVPAYMSRAEKWTYDLDDNLMDLISDAQEPKV